MKAIVLSKGLAAFVDDADYDWLAAFNWYAIQSRVGCYAVRSGRRRKDGSRETIRMHRLVAGASGAELVDHINGNTLDNQRSNLRKCSRLENSRNRKKTQGTSSRFKGVSWCSKRGKWRADIKLNGKTIYLGMFHTEEEAARVYNQHAAELFGEFVRQGR